MYIYIYLFIYLYLFLYILNLYQLYLYYIKNYNLNLYLFIYFILFYFYLFIYLYRYSSEVDVGFVRKSVRSIGRCAIKIPEATDECIDVLIRLIHTKVDYVVQEAVVVIRVSLYIYIILYKHIFK